MITEFTVSYVVQSKNSLSQTRYLKLILFLDVVISIIGPLPSLKG